ncbi:hypothetical protein GE061_014810 [Apolygus lucorum]|uniref:Cytosol aminopeptidase n=1 Tax=Apolygus lucorum TaxID=248454 RepID=A0A8S9XJB9_APOLU|nr:hypothetical protein GE061_014810 [Apolygus lucorum]
MQLQPTHETNAWNILPNEDAGCVGEAIDGKALVLGAYTCEENSEQSVPKGPRVLTLTRTALRFNAYACNRVITQLKASGPFPHLGEVRLLYNVDPSFPIIALVGIGNACYGYNKVEQRDEGKEAIRIAVGAACRAAQDLQVSKLYIENFGHTESAAEGAALSLWIYQDLKNKSSKTIIPYLGLYDDCDWTGWQIGLEKAAAQNLARQLMESPSNLMTPTAFALSTVEALVNVGANVEVRVQEWAKENNMNAFLAVAKGSAEAPIFLEVNYNGCDPCLPPVVLVGKGITFDSGGLCLKTTDEMTHMKGDMAGAACVVATVRAIASLRLPINIRGLIPLCENMPGASATKPGDIVRAMNGKTILIGNTDNEGQLILADALSYAQKYKPKFIMDVGTLTNQLETVMGPSATGVWTNDDNLWISLKAASIHTGDRVWRLPLWEDYCPQVTPSHVSVDLTNVPETGTGISSAVAAFLSHFICYHRWIHLDTFGVMVEIGETPYLRAGMSGRPTRTIIEFLAQMACKPPDC